MHLSPEVHPSADLAILFYYETYFSVSQAPQNYVATLYQYEVLHI